MSISDAEANRQRQDAEIAEKHSKEAEARPDAVHRALHFLLTQTMQNNPDTTREAKFHMETLDRELSQESVDPETGEPKVSRRFASRVRTRTSSRSKKAAEPAAE